MYSGVPDDHPGDRQAAGDVAEAGHAEVDEVRVPREVEQHVGGLDVAVDDPVAVGGRQGVEEDVGEAVDLSRREGAVVVHLLGEGAALQVGEHQHDVVAVVDDVEEGHDRRVLEALEGGRLPPDALAGPVHLVGAALQQQALARDLAAVGSDGEVDHAHASAPEPALHHVLHEAPSLRGQLVEK